MVLPTHNQRDRKECINSWGISLSWKSVCQVPWTKMPRDNWILEDIHWGFCQCRTSSVSLYSLLYSFRSVTWGLRAPTSACSRRGPRGFFHSECCSGGKLMTAPRVNRLLASTNAEHEAGQVASTVFHVFRMIQLGIESKLPASVARALAQTLRPCQQY